MKFSIYLRKLRKENYISQGDLAKSIGVSRQCVSKWELGINEPKVDKLVAIGKAFDIDVSTIIKHIT